jgi:hypothetical protein
MEEDWSGKQAGNCRGEGRASTSRAGSHYSVVESEYDGLNTVSETQFGKHARDVGLDRRGTSKQLFCDLGVAEPLSHQPEDFRLPMVRRLSSQDASDGNGRSANWAMTL